MCTAVMLNSIISRQLAGSGCNKLLSGDGITTSDFTIKSVPGIFGAISVDIRAARKSTPAIGEAASVAKNLDEYQFMICSLVPSLPDSHPSKMQLQKYRVAIVASFAKLVPILKEKPGDLVQWSTHARSLLEETSEAYVKAKEANAKLQVASHKKEAFEFFGVPEDRIDAALRAFYGQ